MKPTKLIIKNIGKIVSETIQIDKPLILFYGEKPAKVPADVGVFVVEEGKLL